MSISNIYIYIGMYSMCRYTHTHTLTQTDQAHIKQTHTHIHTQREGDNPHSVELLLHIRRPRVQRRVGCERSTMLCARLL